MAHVRTLSRTISHALRHEPWLYELELDNEGWVDVEALLSALRSRRRKWSQLTEQDIVRVMEAADVSSAVSAGWIGSLSGVNEASAVGSRRVSPDLRRQFRLDSSFLLALSTVSRRSDTRPLRPVLLP